MGRMFRIISEAAEPARTSNRIGPVPMYTDVNAAEVIPFIEVGGPSGVVTSLPTLEPVGTGPDLSPASPDAEPMIRALSVALHRFGSQAADVGEPDTLTDLIVVHDPDHPVSREYAVVAGAITDQYSDSGPRQFLMTAETPASGTTTVLLNLAASLARDASVKVLVVDANFLRPAMAERLGAASSPGLAEVLDQSVPLTWAIQPTEVPRVHVMATGADVPKNPSSLTDLPRLMAQLRQWFDWVLVDAGVWAESIAADAIAATSDGVYVVSREDRICTGEFAELRESVVAAGGRPRGYVTTRL